MVGAVLTAEVEEVMSDIEVVPWWLVLIVIFHRAATCGLAHFVQEFKAAGVINTPTPAS